MGTIPRTYWQNSTGAPNSGTPVNNEELQKIYDAVEADIRSANFPFVSAKSIIDNNLAKLPFEFGGHYDLGEDRAGYATGATVGVLHPGTCIWRVNSLWLTGVIWLEAMMKVTAGNGKISLVNLTDAPDLSIIELTTASVDGELVQAGPINFAVGGALKNYGIKGITTTLGAQVRAWGIRAYRVS